MWIWAITTLVNTEKCTFVIQQTQGRKPKLFPQRCTVNPLFSQHIIHVWHIRGNVHSGISSSLHYYYLFSKFFFLFFSMSCNLKQAAFNSCKHSFTCTLLIQVYYSAAYNTTASATATAAADVAASHLFWLASDVSGVGTKWRSERLINASCEWLRWAPSFCMSTTHTHNQLHTLPHFCFPPPPLLVFRRMPMHTCAHNGELLGAILGMSGHCCMFSPWLFSEIPLMNRK